MKHKEQPKRRTTIGGQALIEGIMMQGPERVATVVRKSDGRHVVQETAVKRHGRLAKIPFLRGIFVFGASIKNGTKQLMFSANEADVPEAEPSKFDRWVEKKIGMEKAEKILTNIAIVLGVLLPVVVNLSYEANRLVGRYDNWLTKALRAPGLALQLLTTKEPDDEMIKVAIDALERVIPAEKGADQW